MSDPDLIHATVVAVRRPGGWRAALIRGPSGAGKSDLALRLIGRGWRLVADDYAHVWASGDGLFAAPPERIAGRMEVRGLGIVPVLHRAPVRVVLIVDAAEGEPERLPEPALEVVGGVAAPRLTAGLLRPSAVDLVAAAVERL